MAITEKVGEAHEGKIFLRSQLDRGTEITIELPLRKGEPGAGRELDHAGDPA